MGQLQIYNGKLLIVGGQLATSADCCCGQVVCAKICGCCFSADANVTTGDWPLVEKDPAYGWGFVAPFFEDQYWPRIITILNAARPGTQTFPMFDSGGLPYTKSVTATGGTENDTDYYGTPSVPVTWTFTPTITYKVVFRIWSLDTVCSWGIETTALIHIVATDGTTTYEDYTLDLSIDGYFPTPLASQCCGAAGGSTTWGGNVNDGLQLITGTGGQGDIVVSGNKCCRSSDIGENGYYDCTYSGTENCANKDDDALCIPLP